MPKLSESQKDRLRTLTVEVLLEVRMAYLRTTGANSLKNWDILQTRLRIATRMATTPEQWATQLIRGLGITQAMSVSGSSALVDLVSDIHENGYFRQWRHMLDTEWGLLIAKARLIVEKQKAG